MCTIAYAFSGHALPLSRLSQILYQERTKNQISLSQNLLILNWIEELQKKYTYGENNEEGWSKVIKAKRSYSWGIDRFLFWWGKITYKFKNMATIWYLVGENN